MTPVFFALGCAKHLPPAEAPDPIAAQQELASVPGPDQTLETVRLASMALERGDEALAEQALRQAVVRMQDFRAEGEVRALVGAESSKEWKGEPYEKMMAFLRLGQLLLAKGDEGNALAMTKSAILADTGTNEFQYRADFVPAFVLQSLVYSQLGEPQNAARSAQAAVDALFLREYTAILSDRLAAAELAGASGADPGAEEAARLLLLSALPAGLAQAPREPDRAVELALSRALDLRQVALESKRSERPDDLVSLSKGDLRRSFDVLEPLVAAWRAELAENGASASEAVQGDAAAIEELAAHPPRLVVWVEDGVGPTKIADGRYGEILRMVPRSEPREPAILLDGEPVLPTYLDSVTWQASTRGSRKVDGFLKGKAAFKDASPILGYALLVSGDVASALQDSDDSGAVAAVLYSLGALTWIAGAVTNPRADTRAWDELPESLWLVAADPSPGAHELTVDGRVVPLQVAPSGMVSVLVPAGPDRTNGGGTR